MSPSVHEPVFEQLSLFGPEDVGPEPAPDDDLEDEAPGWWVITTHGEVWAKLRYRAAVNVLLEGLCTDHVVGTYVEWVPD